ncbi:MAG: glucan biosynthesis protein [Pikeienuella sp.]|uniref:glucan biosynthesis protein n=1 Tax=Pikeienuella sp. TaxID=2831957 RepID=UPI00391C8CFE
MNGIDRRTLFLGALALAGATGAPLSAQPRLGPAEPFGFAQLADRARRMAGAPWAPPATPPAGVLDRIDYDAYWRIRFRDDSSIRLGTSGPAAQFFHLGRYAREPVAVHVVEDGAAREVVYEETLFDVPADSPAHEMGPLAGFAGVRFMRPGLRPDWLSFLGASYFRCDGPEAQYGLSARGLAIDTGLSRPEEFPRFSAFWIGAGEREGEDVTVHALLDSPSVTGAYRFGATREAGFGQRLAIETRLFFRNGVERLGVAPLTSMFWYSETNRASAPDWRPEIHDSDGLALHTGAGERLWRPLRNPARVTTSSFFDRDPRGFGLIQRDREFDHYHDDGVFYDRRPSVWIEPRGSWGAGAVQLVEIPTADETFDNIVAYWTPAAQPAAGAALSFDYDQHWRALDPFPETLAHVVATWSGWGGVPGQPRPADVDKIAVDFAGGALGGLEEGVEFELEARGGEILIPRAYRVVGSDRWRLMFDLRGAHSGPVELRAYLHRGGEPLTETWTWLAEGGAPRGLSDG